jgi:hypothetical protein
MNTTASVARQPSNNFAVRNVLFGGLLAGFLDFVYPTVKTIISGNSWMQPWKGVASGLLGQAGRDGGVEMAILGACLHFFICISGAALLYLLASRAKFVPRQWIVLGILYGVAVLLTMNYIILPLSAIGRPIYPVERLYISAFFHILLVGLPTAFFVSRALRPPYGKPGTLIYAR